MKAIESYINEKLVINKNSIDKCKPADAKNVDTWQVGDIFYWQILGTDVINFAKVKAITKTDITCDFLDSKENNGEYTPINKVIYNDASFYLTKKPNNITVCKFNVNNFAKLWDGNPVKATIDEKLIINKDSINNSSKDSDYQYVIILPKAEIYTYYYKRYWKQAYRTITGVFNYFILSIEEFKKSINDIKNYKINGIIEAWKIPPEYNEEIKNYDIKLTAFARKYNNSKTIETLEKINIKELP